MTPIDEALCHRLRRSRRAALVLALAASVGACGGGSGAGVSVATSASSSASAGTAASASAGTAAGGSGVAPAPAGGAHTATLLLHIDGPNAGVNADTVKVAGAATLSGALVIEFGSAYTPAPGTHYTVLQAVGGVHGAFDTVSNNKGLTLKMTQDANGVYIMVQS